MGVCLLPGIKKARCAGLLGVSWGVMGVLRADFGLGRSHWVDLPPKGKLCPPKAGVARPLGRGD